jgi:4-oxalocrotonate tautomerase
MHRPTDREARMPHVNVRLYAGRSDADKASLAEAIAKALTETLGSSERSISVAIEDVAPDDWMTEVYDPEITAKADRLYKRPGYGPASS